MHKLVITAPSSLLQRYTPATSPRYTPTASRITMPSAVSPPEEYLINHSTPHVPNSRLPVLVYRSALPLNPTPESTCATVEPNGWLKGGVFKHYPAHHFHSVTHECYAVFKGHSRLLLGRGPLDPVDGEEVLVDLRMGDAIVLPAGVAHCSMNTFSSHLNCLLAASDFHPRCCLLKINPSPKMRIGSVRMLMLTLCRTDLESSDDYEYVGLYPKVRESLSPLYITANESSGKSTLGQ
jgi:uncharacterized protein YjlB